jgi:hypothetical protein
MTTVRNVLLGCVVALALALVGVAVYRSTSGGGSSSPGTYSSTAGGPASAGHPVTMRAGARSGTRHAAGPGGQ